MTDDIIKKVPQNLEDSVLIFQDNKINTVALVSDVVADDGRPVLVALLLKSTERSEVAK